MTPLYQMLSGAMPIPGQATPQQAPVMNPVQMLSGAIQQAQAIYQSMRSPQAFVKQQFPDIPNEIMGDPQRILSYIQQTRNISDEQLNQIAAQMRQY